MRASERAEVWGRASLPGLAPLLCFCLAWGGVMGRSLRPAVPRVETGGMLFFLLLM